MQTVKKLTIAFVLLGVLVALAILVRYLAGESIVAIMPVSVQRKYPIEFLNQIVPGQTNLHDALAILGEPDSIEDSSYHPTRLFNNVFDSLADYKVYIFSEKLGWRHTELWIQKHGFSQRINAVLWFLPSNVRDFENNPSLYDFIVVYGRPDEIYWSSNCYFRYLIWLDQGVAIEAGSQLFMDESDYQKLYAWNEIPITTIFLFEPTDGKGLSDIDKWPWPNNGAAWNSSNTDHSPSCTEDRAPKDSFDWENMPVLSP